MFTPDDFFDLSDYEHAAIFRREDVKQVWDVLHYIGDYLAGVLEPDIQGQVDPRAYLVGDDIYIAEGAVVEPGAYIAGPSYIGAGTVVRHGAYIRGKVITGKNCIIGHDTEVKNAILLNKAQAPHYNYVGDSVLGAGVNIGAGVRLANFKLRGTEVTIRHEGERIATGLRKFGAILGDGVSVGCNTVCNPGTLLGPNSNVYALTRVFGYHPPQSLLK